MLLLDRKRMGSRLQQDTRPLPPALGLNLTFQVRRIGIAVKPIGKPAEPGTEPILLATVESLDVTLEVRARQRRPHAETESLSTAALDREFQHSSHKEM